MIPRTKDGAKRKANSICGRLRDAGCIWHKRYSEIRISKKALRVKLFAVDCDFMQGAIDSLVLDDFDRLHVKYSFLDREGASYTKSFIFWIPLADL